jgi:hypothetical protein
MDVSNTDALCLRSRPGFAKQCRVYFNGFQRLDAYPIGTTSSTVAEVAFSVFIDRYGRVELD